MAPKRKGSPATAAKPASPTKPSAKSPAKTPVTPSKKNSAASKEPLPERPEEDEDKALQADVPDKASDAYVPIQGSCAYAKQAKVGDDLPLQTFCTCTHAKQPPWRTCEHKGCSKNFHDRCCVTTSFAYGLTIVPSKVMFCPEHNKELQAKHLKQQIKHMTKDREAYLDKRRILERMVALVDELQALKPQLLRELDAQLQAPAEAEHDKAPQLATGLEEKISASLKEYAEIRQSCVYKSQILQAHAEAEPAQLVTAVQECSALVASPEYAEMKQGLSGEVHASAEAFEQEIRVIAEFEDRVEQDLRGRSLDEVVSIIKMGWRCEGGLEDFIIHSVNGV